MVRSTGIKLALTGFLLVAGWASETAIARDGAGRVDTSTVSVDNLPRQAVHTYRLIHQGGPFPYEKDGSVFGNRERQLPARKRGYYREYTVATPGARNRGARRIVCGGVPRAPDACYYTADHYESFRRIVP